MTQCPILLITTNEKEVMKATQNTQEKNTYFDSVSNRRPRSFDGFSIR